MKFKAVFFGLLMSFSMLSGHESNDCYYETNKMEEEKKYYVYNAGKNHCKWIAKSPYVIITECEFDIPYSNNCTKASVSIQFGGKKPEKYCGKRKKTIIGRKNVTIIYDTQSNTERGEFLCEIQTYNLDCSCGSQNPTKIVGGEETGINEYPMMAGLFDVKNRELYCGATIISDQYVLTAAHCVKKRNINTIIVVVGEHDVRTGKETNATRVYRVNGCTTPIENYEYEEFNNDIAICQINGTIFYNTKVGPVCLPFQHRCDSFVGSFVYLLGWGLTEFGGSKSPTLQGITTTVTSNLMCKDSYPEINSTHICTIASNKDACQMDSGGPVLWKNPETSRLVLVGIINGGIGCAIPGKPGLNTRVGYYIDWIKSVTPGVHYCDVE